MRCVRRGRAARRIDVQKHVHRNRHRPQKQTDAGMVYPFGPTRALHSSPVGVSSRWRSPREAAPSGTRRRRTMPVAGHKGVPRFTARLHRDDAPRSADAFRRTDTTVSWGVFEIEPLGFNVDGIARAEIPRSSLHDAARRASVRRCARGIRASSQSAFTAPPSSLSTKSQSYSPRTFETDGSCRTLELVP
jgi:hypothetical protein